MDKQKNKNFVSKLMPPEPSDALITADGVVFEGMTSLSGILHGIDRGTNSRRVLRVYFDRDRWQKKEKEYRFLAAHAAQYGYTMHTVPGELLSQVTLGTTHGGIVAVCSEREIPSLSQAILDTKHPFSSDHGFFVLLEGIEDPYNFGYTLRSLYAAGADGVILSPRHWMHVAGIVAKSSAGTSEQLPLAVSEPSEAMTLFRQRGYRLVCAGIRRAVSMYDADLKKPLFVVIGGEKRGISASSLAQADSVVKIEYGRTFQGSLSAASAATVLAFEVLRQNRNLIHVSDDGKKM